MSFYKITNSGLAICKESEADNVHISKYKELKERIAKLEQAIMSNCYDDPSTSGKRLMALVSKGGDV